MDWESQAVEPLTWQYAAGSVVQYNLRWLHACGVWSLSGSRLYRIFTATITAMSMAHIAEGIVHLCTMYGDLEDYTVALSCLSIMVVGTTKAAFFFFNEAGYCRLVRWLDALVESQREHVRSRPIHEKTFNEVQKSVLRISKTFFVYSTSLLSVWFVAPLMLPEEKRLPFQQLPTINATALPMYTYEVSYVLQVISMFFVATAHVLIDCFFIVVMFHTSAQLKILTARIADLQLPKGEMNGLCECNKDKRLQSVADNETYKQLCLCIQTHQDITRFIGYLESVMNPIAMMQLAIGVFNGCMLIFPAAYSNEMGAVLKGVACAPLVSMQLLLYCVGAHSVREQGELVSLAAYSCDWPDASVSFQRTLLLVMIRGQKPLTLTAGGIYPIQRGTFLTLLNAGYSYYAVLKNCAGR